MSGLPTVSGVFNKVGAVYTSRVKLRLGTNQMLAERDLARAVMMMHLHERYSRLALTGSQFFGNATEFSDFDYYTDEADVDVSDLGFVHLEHYDQSKGWDKHTIKVLRNYVCAIDICIVPDMRKRAMVDVMLRELGLVPAAGVKWNRETWDAAYAAIDGIMNVLANEQRE